MIRYMKTFISKLISKLIPNITLILLLLCLFYQIPFFVYAQEEPNLSSQSAVLLEPSTKTVLYEKNAHDMLPPASITKIMTLLITFDQLAKGNVHLDDSVTVSEHAASMGGSQVYLEPGETQTLDTMIKCVVVSSANDACVAISEHIAGSEEAFVTMMNERAKGLGMKDTTFLNCNGLDVEGHQTSAYDIALMSAELMSKYPEIEKYTTIWMDTITHTTARGESEFELSSTNKLLKMSPDITGLKTGFTSKAKFCVSASGRRNDINLISVILAAPDSKTRFSEALTLLNYGFSICQMYTAPQPKNLSLPVKFGIQEQVSLMPDTTFQYLDVKGNDLTSITEKYQLPEYATAPLHIKDKAGTVEYYLNGSKIGSCNLVYKEDVGRITFRWCLCTLMGRLML